MFLTTRGLVLREVRYKESDKILTVLTQHEGKITVRARGALRKGSRITAATQLLTYSDMTIFENRGRRTLNEASTVEEFLGLRADLGAFALGSYFAELLETVSAEEYPDPPVLQLGLNSLYALSRALCPPEQIKAVFELRLMCLAGYEPDLSCCARCGAPECRGASSSAVTPLLPETLAAMRHVVNADPKKIFSFTLGDAGRRQLARVCEEYTAMQLERGFASLDYWKKVKDDRVQGDGRRTHAAAHLQGAAGRGAGARAAVPHRHRAAHESRQHEHQQPRLAADGGVRACAL